LPPLTESLYFVFGEVPRIPNNFAVTVANKLEFFNHEAKWFKTEVVSSDADDATLQGGELAFGIVSVL
jgi:hypothetical protein